MRNNSDPGLSELLHLEYPLDKPMVGAYLQIWVQAHLFHISTLMRRAVGCSKADQVWLSGCIAADTKMDKAQNSVCILQCRQVTEQTWDIWDQGYGYTGSQWLPMQCCDWRRPIKCFWLCCAASPKRLHFSPPHAPLSSEARKIHLEQA